MAAVLSVNGCTEIENLLEFCRIPKERIRVVETKELKSPKVWDYCVFKEKKKIFYASVKNHFNFPRWRAH